jgi:hypothetical protein
MPSSCHLTSHVIEQFAQEPDRCSRLLLAPPSPQPSSARAAIGPCATAPGPQRSRPGRHPAMHAAAPVRHAGAWHSPRHAGRKAAGGRLCPIQPSRQGAWVHRSSFPPRLRPALRRPPPSPARRPAPACPLDSLFSRIWRIVGDKVHVNYDGRVQGPGAGPPGLYHGGGRQLASHPCQELKATLDGRNREGGTIAGRVSTSSQAYSVRGTWLAGHLHQALGSEPAVRCRTARSPPSRARTQPARCW